MLEDAALVSAIETAIQGLVVGVAVVHGFSLVQYYLSISNEE